ncbi:HNH endonuclease signature motif containing protein [Streptomyces sp. NPDC006984]|uniref:HNH endonuclease n=1 Tax=Streptomyces sp. NPDC006984 TaxID=3155463 RepID=UPI0033E2B5C5
MPGPSGFPGGPTGRGPRCGLCGEGFSAELVDVDHRTPLALGGEDTDDDVWPLCRTCHRGKTAEDCGWISGRCQ